MISFLAAFLDQRRVSEARKAAAAPRRLRDNAAPRAAYSGKSTLRCNTPAELRPAAQPPVSSAAQRTASDLRCNRPTSPAPPRSREHPARRSALKAPPAATYQRQPCPAALEQSKKSSRRTWQEAARGALSAFSPRGLLFAACNRLRLICPTCLATLQQNSTVRGGCACGRR